MGDHEVQQHVHNGSTRRQGEREKEKKILKEIILESFSSLMNYINPHVQEAQLTPSRINASPHPDTLCPKNA